MSAENNIKKKKEILLKATREGFSEGLIEAAKNDERVYAVCADLSSSVGMKEFTEQFPSRFVEVGVAEQNLVTVASGLAAGGKIPFAASFAMFSPGRNWEQIRTTICYNNQPVKIVGSHAGLGVGEDGATHQALEDIALMRVIPNMQVIVPCDATQTKKATIEIAKTKNPTYLRIFRQKTPIITKESDDFAIGKIQVIDEGNEKRNNVTIISSGPILCNVIEAKKLLSKSKISCAVLNCHTIKPLDEQTILKFAEKSDAIAVVEDHQITGGLGGAIAELLSSKLPKKIIFIGMNDSFGESGSDKELYAKYKLDSAGISKKIKNELQKKNKNLKKINLKKNNSKNVVFKKIISKKISSKSSKSKKTFLRRK